LLGTVEKSVYLNLIKIILKFGFVGLFYIPRDWINVSVWIGELFWKSSSQVREASFNFFNSNSG